MKYVIAVVMILAIGCNKPADKPSDNGGGGGGRARSGLPWQPDGYDKLSVSCLKALSCCEAIVAGGNPGASAGDYNGACSGPASGAWKNADCDADVKSRAAGLAGKPVPEACK